MVEVSHLLRLRSGVGTGPCSRHLERRRIMRKAKGALHVAFVAAALAGMALLVGSREPSGAAAAQKPALKSHWRYFDGHWNYWHAGDRRWYYTNGENWYYYDDPAWKVYRFDTPFGREGFETGEYKVPAADVKVVVPRHRVWRPR
jgi:hypothetical protein